MQSATEGRNVGCVLHLLRVGADCYVRYRFNVFIREQGHCIADYYILYELSPQVLLMAVLVEVLLTVALIIGIPVGIHAAVHLATAVTAE